ncbi:MAG: hypothetical protein AB1403_10245 [Candidatus Riflebacteria bacterium]
MKNTLRLQLSRIVLFAFFLGLPIFSGAATGDGPLHEKWVEEKRFSDFSIDDRFGLLEELARQNGGADIFRSSMDSFEKEVKLRTKIIDTRMDLKRLFDSFRIKGLKFHTSEKVKIKGEKVFRGCFLFSIIEELCLNYKMKCFYHNHELYFIIDNNSISR